MSRTLWAETNVDFSVDNVCVCVLCVCTSEHGCLLSGLLQQ